VAAAKGNSMATTLLISCPECDKKIKAPAELKGKKIRCKGCGHAFVVQGGGGDEEADVLPVQAEPARPKAAKPKRPAQPAAPVDDEDNPDPYAVTSLTEGHRCPHCAYEMESEDSVICLHCGYNTLTRTHHGTKKTLEHTNMDWFLWWLPAILCILWILSMIISDILYLLLIDTLVGDSDWMTSWLAHGGIKLWMIIVSLFFMFFAGRFAVKRLIFNYRPPEKEKR
jgi:hypothetical protein